MNSDLLARVLAPNPSLMTLQGTNTYVLGRAQLAIIDPGPDIASHVEATLAEAERRGRVELVLVTHYHSDHLPAARSIRQRTGAPILGHPTLSGVDRPLEDGERLALGDLTIQALYTPGHTRDHFCYLAEKQGWLFTGDLVAGTGTVVVGPPDGHLGDYMRSLERLLTLPLTRLLPGHGPIVEQPKAKLEEYLRHRRMREAQVIEALKQGCTRVEEMVPLIYADVTPRLHPQAAGNVLAHLLKLQDEGRVERSSQGWRLRVPQ